MARAQRLLALLQCLRRYRQPVSGKLLAEQMGVSLRTLYRDIASLQAQGAEIEGEAGLGYILRPGFLLPPLMFSEEEIEALVLGSRWVAERGGVWGDPRLALAARDALAKIAAVLPEDLRRTLDHAPLLVGPGEDKAQSVQSSQLATVELALLRQAIRRERKLIITYLDLREEESQRTLWPFALGFFERVRVLVAWCELRGDYRHFRVDRILSAEISESRLPRRRQALLREWREREGIPQGGKHC